LERFIHGEIFRARPAHTPLLLPLTASAMGGNPLPLLPDPKGGNGYGRGWDAWIKDEERLVK